LPISKTQRNLENTAEPVKSNHGHAFSQLTVLGNQLVEIGMPVEMVTRRLRSDGDEREVLVYGYKFRPAVVSD
jgi:uncharacterized OB-fold protein